MNVSPQEWIVVGASVVLFTFVPALLEWRAPRRRSDRPRDRPEPTGLSYGTDGTDTTDGTGGKDATGSAALPTDVPVAAAVPLPEPPPARSWPAGTALDAEFVLADLRDAGALARPWDDRALATDADAWKRIGALRGALEAAVLRAPQRPQSYAIAGIERDAAGRRIVALLFAELWPEGAHSATARAVFELDDDRITAARTEAPVAV